MVYGLIFGLGYRGFHLDMEGNEDIYTDGKYYIACNKNNRTVRIQKV